MTEYSSCPAIEGGCHFQHDALKLCCVIHSGGKGGPTIADYRGGELPFDRIAALRERLRADNQRDVDTPCKGCPFLVKQEWPTDDGKLRQVGIGHFAMCNLACTYCETTTMSPPVLAHLRRPAYELYPVFQSLIAAGRLAPRCRIEWGGGEPTILDEYERLAKLLLDRGAEMVLYTNATTYSEATAAGLAAGQVSLVCSVDAGARDTYRRLKGKDCFDRVWENLGRYAERGMVIAKYIVIEQNCAEEEVLAFVEQAHWRGIRAVAIARDVRQERLSKQVIDAMALLAVAALRRQMRFQFHVGSVTAAERLRAKARMAELFAVEHGCDPDSLWARDSRFFADESNAAASDGQDSIERLRRDLDEAVRQRDRLASSIAFRVGSRITRPARRLLSIGGVHRLIPEGWRNRVRKALRS